MLPEPLSKVGGEGRLPFHPELVAGGGGGSSSPARWPLPTGWVGASDCWGRVGWGGSCQRKGPPSVFGGIKVGRIKGESFNENIRKKEELKQKPEQVVKAQMLVPLSPGETLSCLLPSVATWNFSPT